MGTDIRPELSEKNPYYIGRNRYYELKHFCLQYPGWQKAYLGLKNLGVKSVNLAEFVRGSGVPDPTAKRGELLSYYFNRIKMVEDSARETDDVIGEYVLRGVTEGLSYTCLRTKYNIPCGRDYYYDAYRRFFWILDKSRE